MSAHPAPYRGSAANSNGQAATQNFFYGNTNATQQASAKFVFSKSQQVQRDSNKPIEGALENY